VKYFADGARHLVTVPYNDANLRLAADDLGVNRNWLHRTSGLHHLDIPIGAVERILGDPRVTRVTSRRIVQICRGRTTKPLRRKPKPGAGPVVQG
jgi:hypothetical protein